MAAAVLCRAVLEQALIERVDPDRKMKPGPDQSYIELLLKGAPVPDATRYLEIRDAGNDAVHDPERFEKKWSGKIKELLQSTREVVEKLSASRGLKSDC